MERITLIKDLKDKLKFPEEFEQQKIEEVIFKIKILKVKN